jgi:hypothetical protein
MNMKSKYLVLATTLLLALSSTASVATAATHGVLFVPSALDTHGPRISSIDFSVIASDPSLAGSLVTGTIQAPEWTFTAGSYGTLAASVSVKEGKTEGYSFQGIVFNGIQPIISSYDFRQAIQLLTVYSGAASLASTVLTGDLAGVATADLMPCNLYNVYNTPGSCAAEQKADLISPDQVHPEGWVSSQIKDEQAAAADLDSIPKPTGWWSGLFAQLNGANVTAATISGWSVATATANLPSLLWYVNGSKLTPWSPNLQYRSDDPLRTGAAVLLTAYAGDIGLVINAQGISDAVADATVYTDFVIPLTNPGGYCTTNTNSTGTFPGNAGTNNCPSPVWTTNSLIQSEDPWDMYTYGWVASSNFEFQGGEWMNTQFLADGIDPGYIVSQQCDIYNNQVLYATTYALAEAAALNSEACSVKNLPDIVMYYESYLYGEYINGWTGYAAMPTIGPNSVTGAYYTFLNAHSTTAPYVQGELNYALHGAASVGGLNPIYGTNWVWQADLWSELYDAPLETPPTYISTPGAWIPWMLSGETTPTSTYGPCAVTGLYGKLPYGDAQCGVQVATYTLARTGVGTGISNIPTNAFCIQNTTTTCDLTIPNGEAVTYTFNSNMTWSDETPITAYDYNYSLWALDVAGTPALAAVGDYTPFAFADAGPFGLLATTVQTLGNGQTSITMYMGDQAFWNIIAVDVPVLPMHEFQYINVYNAFVFHSSIDLSQSYATEYTANPGFFQGVCSTPATCPLAQLPNLEVSSGPFYLYTFTPATGAGVMNANLGYYRTAWWDALTDNRITTTATINFNFSEPMYLSTGFVYMDTANGATSMTCSYSIQKYTAPIPLPTVNKYTGTPTGAPWTGLCKGTGAKTEPWVDVQPSLMSPAMTAGVYKVTLTECFHYLAYLPTLFCSYQYYGFAVGSGLGYSPTEIIATPTSL